jgi:hypothetical protein
MLVFGGWAGGNVFLNDMFALDVNRLKWTKVSNRAALKLNTPKPNMS